jgi:hypothetical protein
MQVSKNLMKRLRRRVSTDYFCAITQLRKTSKQQLRKATIAKIN